MKKLSFILIVLYAFTTGCTKEITDLNTNTKATLVAPSAAVFLYGQKKFEDYYTSTSVSSAPFRVLAQTWTENTYVYEAQYNFAAYQANSGWFTNWYTGVISNLDQAKTLFPNDVKDPNILRNDVAIADLMEVYAYYFMVNTYGNVPYNKLSTTNPFPAYSDAKTVYYDLLTRVDTCIAALNTASTAMGSSDQIYAGNVTQWKKFAATLKLKMAMLIADIDPTTASKKVGEAITTGIFTSSADNPVFNYDASTTGNTNPIWQALVNSGRHDFVPANLLVNTMVGWSDPRVPLYFTKDPNGLYTGGVPGAGNGYGIFSDFTPTIQSKTYPGDILDYVETEFLLAEAAERSFPVSGTAATHYNNAVTASVQFWGGSATSAATYLATPSVAYATATGTWRQKIGYQKWIAFYNRNWDSWTEIRRLGYPNLDVVNPPVAAQGKLPLRLTYPNNEQVSNSVNWAAAVQALPGGKDVVSAKLFWMQ